MSACRNKRVLVEGMCANDLEDTHDQGRVIYRPSQGQALLRVALRALEAAAVNRKTRRHSHAAGHFAPICQPAAWKRGPHWRATARPPAVGACPGEAPGTLRVRCRSPLAQELYHVDFRTAQGAVPVTTSHTVPASVIDYPSGAPAAAGHSATTQTAMYMAAARESAELGQPEPAEWAEWAFQTGAQEAEKHVVVRFLEAPAGNTGVSPPNNKAFETDPFLYTGDGINGYKALGFIGGSGAPFTYLGRDAILGLAGPIAATMERKKPNNATSSVEVTGPETLTGERP